LPTDDDLLRVFAFLFWGFGFCGIPFSLEFLFQF
jgi:hypothetical protein